MFKLVSEKEEEPEIKLPTSAGSWKKQPSRLLFPWDSPGQNTGVGSHCFLQGIFLTQGITVKGFGIVNKAEVDVFLELSCFFYDPVDVGNWISGSSAFSKSSLNIRKFMVHVLLKPGLENFEHYFTSMGVSAIMQ